METYIRNMQKSLLNNSVVLLAAILLPCCSQPSEIQQKPAEAFKSTYSDYYKVTHNENEVPVYYSRVGAFVIIDLGNEKNKLTIENHAPIETVEVIPSLGPGYEVENSTLVLNEVKPGKYFIKIDRNYVYPLMVFGYAAEEKKEGSHVFPAGIHDAGEIVLASGDHLILEKGAIVYGNVISENATNIRISGTGILKGTKIPMDEKAGIHLINCSDITISDITSLDPAKANIVLEGSSNVQVRNVNLIGNRELRMNDDGIHITNSRGVDIANVLTNTRNNSVSLRHNGNLDGFNQDIRVSRSWFWKGDYGDAIDITYGADNGKLKDISFKDIDIIHCEGGAAISMTAEAASFTDITLEDIRVMNASFMFLDIQLQESTTLENIVFRNIDYSGINHAYSRLEVKHNPGNLKIIGARYKGNTVTSPGDLYLRTSTPGIDIIAGSL